MKSTLLRKLAVVGLFAVSASASAATVSTTYSLSGAGSSSQNYSYLTNTFSVAKYSGASPLLGVTITLSASLADGAGNASAYDQQLLDPLQGSFGANLAMYYSASSTTLANRLKSSWDVDATLMGAPGITPSLVYVPLDYHVTGTASDSAPDEAIAFLRPNGVTDPSGLNAFLADFQGTGAFDVTLSSYLLMAIDDSNFLGRVDLADVTNNSVVSLTVTYDFQSVSEPGMLALTALGVLGLGGMRRRRV